MARVRFLHSAEVVYISAFCQMFRSYIHCKFIVIKSAMEILGFCKTYLKLLSLWSIPGWAWLTSPIITKIRYSIILLFGVTLLVGSFRFAVLHLDDVNEATEPGFVCFAFITSLFAYCWMINKKSLITRAINLVESTVDKSNFVFLLKTLWKKN